MTTSSIFFIFGIPFCFHIHKAIPEMGHFKSSREKIIVHDGYYWLGLALTEATDHCVPNYMQYALGLMSPIDIQIDLLTITCGHRQIRTARCIFGFSCGNDAQIICLARKPTSKQGRPEHLLCLIRAVAIHIRQV